MKTETYLPQDKVLFLQMSLGAEQSRELGGRWKGVEVRRGFTFVCKFFGKHSPVCSHGGTGGPDPPADKGQDGTHTGSGLQEQSFQESSLKCPK